MKRIAEAAATAVQQTLWWVEDHVGAQLLLALAGLTGLLWLAHYWAWPRHPAGTGIVLGILLGGVRKSWFAGGAGKGFLWVGVVAMLIMAADPNLLSYNND